MTDAVDDKPFYEAARERYAPKPPASRLPIYLICAAAFVAGVITFFIGGMPDRPTGEFDRYVAYMVGFKLGGQAVYSVVIGLIGMALLSMSQARKLRQRSSGEDFLGPFLSALGGGLTAVALIFAIGAPDMAANKIAGPIRTAHVAAMDKDAEDFDREVQAVSAGGVLSGDNLSTDPGYRRASGKIEKIRAIVVKYRERQNDRFTSTRRTLAGAIKSEGQRKRVLAAYDADLAKARPLLEQYWDMQHGSVDFMTSTLAILKTSPGEWDGDFFYFRRQADLNRFRAAQETGRQKQAEAEAVRQKLLNLTNAPLTPGDGPFQ